MNDLNKAIVTSQLQIAYVQNMTSVDRKANLAKVFNISSTENGSHLTGTFQGFG